MNIAVSLWEYDPPLLIRVTEKKKKSDIVAKNEAKIMNYSLAALHKKEEK